MDADYRNIGDWQGHLYSVADATSFVDRSGMCASGSVTANAQFQSYALWGWNLNQLPDEPALPWDPKLQSIHYFIGSSTPLQLSLRDEQGRDWCYPIDTTTGDVLLTQFNSACWDMSGAFYDGTTPLPSSWTMSSETLRMRLVFARSILSLPTMPDSAGYAPVIIVP